MPKCSVVGCPVTYTRKKVVHTFKVPSDAATRSVWEKALRLPSNVHFHPNDRVCHRHFLKSDVVEIKVLKSAEGITLGISPLERATLVKGAIPHYVSDSERNDDDRKESEELGERVIKRTYDKPIRMYSTPKRRIQNSKELQTDIDNPNNPSPITVNVKDKISTSDYITFTDITNDHFFLPDSWTRCTAPFDKNFVVIFSLINVLKLDGELKTFFQKEVIVQSEMQFQVNILGKCINTSEMFKFDKIFSKSNLEQILKTVSSLNICRGTTLPVNENKNTELTYVDPSNTLRHKMCLLVTDQDQCRFCKDISN